MGLIQTWLSLSDRKKKTDYGKIRVTSNGAFYMKSQDLFDDKQESLELIKKLRTAVDHYKKLQVNTKK